MRSFTLFILYFSSFVSLCFYSCKKETEFLNGKPNQALALPSSLNDLQLILDNDGVFNFACDPSLGTISADEFYVTSDIWLAAATPTERNAYVFEKDIFQGS